MTPSIDELYPPRSLGDSRLAARALKLLKAMIDKPAAPISALFKGEKNEVDAGYEFFSNERVCPDALIAAGLPHLRQQLQMFSEESPVLAISDTTENNLTSLGDCKRIGPIGNPTNRGFFVHPTILVSPEGVIPLGLSGVQFWARDPETVGKAKDRRNKSFESKESYRWWRSIESALNNGLSPRSVVFIDDREGDVYELMARARQAHARLLVRVAHDRLVVPQSGMQTSGKENEKLFDTVEKFEVCEQSRTVHVGAKKKTKKHKEQPERDAHVLIRYGQVEVRESHKGKGSVVLSVVDVFEPNPPPDCEPVRWLLATTDDVTTEEQAWQRVRWYEARWVIEEVFRTLKHEHRVEDRQYETRERHENHDVLALQASIYVMGLKKLSRQEPDMPASEVFGEAEVAILEALRAQKEEKKLERQNKRAKTKATGKRPAMRIEPMTLQIAVNLVASLGGYMGRKGDGPPGTTTLSRGLADLRLMVLGAEMARQGINLGALADFFRARELWLKMTGTTSLVETGGELGKASSRRYGETPRVDRNPRAGHAGRAGEPPFLFRAVGRAV
jgi:hypothetical protein